MISSLYDFVTMLVIRVRHNEGQTMAEYGILIAVIALVVVAAAIILGGKITGVFSNAGNQL